MAPIGDKHQNLVDTLSEILGDQRKDRYRVRVGGPIRIEDFNEPQPDIVLYKRGVKKHPTPGEIYLVVEVSDTTLAYDSGDKLRAYEQGGIKEYWIVDLVRKAVHIHRLKEGRYQVTKGTVKSPRSIFPTLLLISTNCFSGPKKAQAFPGADVCPANIITIH